MAIPVTMRSFPRPGIRFFNEYRTDYVEFKNGFVGESFIRVVYKDADAPALTWLNEFARHTAPEFLGALSAPGRNVELDWVNKDYWKCFECYDLMAGQGWRITNARFKAMEGWNFIFVIEFDTIEPVDSE